MEKKVYRNVFFSFADKIMVLLFNMAISVIVARYLGATDYGKYTYFVVVYSFVSSFSAFGMEQIVTKELAASKNRQKIILCAAIIVSFVASCFTALGIILLQLITGFLTWMEVIALGIVCFINISSVFHYYLTAIYRMNDIVKIKNALLFMVIIIDLLFMVVGAPVECFILAFALKECCAMGASFIAFIMSKEKDRLLSQDLLLNDIFFMVKKLVRLCFPLLLSGLSVIIYMKIDQIMIKSMLGEGQLGIYSAGIKLVEVFFNVPVALTTGFLPYFAEKYAHEPETFWKRFEQLACGLNGCAYFFTVMIVLLGRWFIYFLYGEEYYGAVDILVSYACVTIPVSMGCARTICTSVMEYSNLNFFFSISSAVVNVILNLLLIPKYGIIGATIASIIAYSLQGFVFTFISPRLRRVARIQAKSLYGFIFIIKDLIGYFRERKVGKL